MFAGHLDAAQNDAVLPAPLQSALRYLRTHALDTHETGRFEIDLDGVPAILQVLDLTTAPRETLRPEIHRENIDVQYLAAGGPECAVWYADLGTDEVDEDLLDTPRDILFYKNDAARAARENTLALTTGSYAMYFPWDVHVPAVQVGAQPSAIRKVVIKVPLRACLGK